MVKLASSILLFIAFVSLEVRAQGINFHPSDEPAYVNEQSVVGSFDAKTWFGGSDCYIIIEGPLQPTRFSYDTRSGLITAYLTEPGLYYDTVRFHVFYNNGVRCGLSGDYDVITYVQVRSDSVVRIRPKLSAIELTAIDTGWYGIDTGWVGMNDGQRLFNNIDDTTLFSNWRLQIDTSLHAELMVLHGQNLIDSFLAAPFDTLKVDLAVKTFRGPIYADSVYKGLLLVDVQNKRLDTTYRLPIELHIAKAPWNPQFGFSSDSIRLDAPAGESVTRMVTLKTDPRTLTHSLRELAGNISRDDVSLQIGMDNEIAIHGKALTRGRYLERLKYECTLPDHNGDPRKADKTLLIELNVTGDQGAAKWEGTTAAMLEPTQVELTADGTVFAAAAPSIYRSTDKGQHWSIYPTDATSYGFAIDIKGRLVSKGEFGLLRYTNNEGAEWSEAPLGLKYGSGTHERFARYNVHHLFTLDSEIHGYGVAIWAEQGETQPRYSQGGGFSTDGGATWKSEIANYGIPVLIVRDSAGHKFTAIRSSVITGPEQKGTSFVGLVRNICVDGHGTLYAATDDGFYASTDGGTTWERRSLVFYGISGFAATPDGELYLAINGGGIYHSSDGGYHWNSLNGGLGTLQVRSMAMRPGFPIYLATNGGGVYRSREIVPLPAKNVVKYASNDLRVVSIASSNEVRITFAPVSSPTVVCIYNVLGQQVSAAKVNAGDSSCTFTLSGLSPGIYFCSSPVSGIVANFIIQD